MRSLLTGLIATVCVVFGFGAMTGVANAAASHSVSPAVSCVSGNSPGRYANGDGNIWSNSSGTGLLETSDYDTLCDSPGTSGDSYLLAQSGYSDGLCLTFDASDLSNVYFTTCGRYPASQDWYYVSQGTNSYQIVNQDAQNLGDNDVLAGETPSGSGLYMASKLAHGSPSENWGDYIP